ncbi:hypothetical protein DX130_13825 [Paenibacillus paeoniae]|uniref:Uncharacterized protein n=1 Tax=Paenibacillus paeoniae TaxID=2292705 RepID=A0A371PFU2_9BACL|nr:hypothetical protein DX130_13825 [Paenibacillus paeoniae]
MLESDEYKDVVKRDIVEAKRLNITRGRFLSALNSIWEEEKYQKPELMELSKEGDSCTIGTCSI